MSKDKVTVNGANVTTLTTVNTTNPNQQVFSIPNALNAGQSLVIVFKALVPANAATGSYCNAFTTTQGGVPETTGALACVTVGGGQIGDTIFRDWNGNGIQDPQDEGLPGVTVQLNTGATVVTDANGKYLFTGLTAGTYTVTVGSGVPAGYTQTADPNGPPLSTSYTLTLATNQQNLTVDFGFKPGGTGTIGDLVFEDKNKNAAFDGTDVGIANVTVCLYEDTNNNGVIDVLTDAKVLTTTTNASGLYSFTNLATA